MFKLNTKLKSKVALPSFDDKSYVVPVNSQTLTRSQKSIPSNKENSDILLNWLIQIAYYTLNYIIYLVENEAYII